MLPSGAMGRERGRGRHGGSLAAGGRGRRRLAWALPLLASAIAAPALGEPPAETVQDRLARVESGATFVLPPGETRGPLVVPAGVRVVAPPEGARLTGDGPVLVVGGPGVIVEGLAVEGGIGLDVRPGGALLARDVRVEARGTGARVAAGGELVLERATITCAAGANGLTSAGTLTGRSVTFRGPCRRAVDVSGGVLALSDFDVAAASDGVRLLDARGTLERGTVALAGPHGAAIFAARTVLKLRRLSLRGGEEGLLLRAGELDAEALTVRASMTGLAFVGGRTSVRGATLAGPFTYWAVSVTDAPRVELRDVGIRDAGAGGVLLLRVDALLERVSVHGARRDRSGDFGHGVLAQEGTGLFRALTFEDVASAGLYVSDARVRVEGLRIRGAAMGLAAVLGARVSLDGLETQGDVAAGVVATQGAVVELHRATVRSPVGYAVCSGSAVAVVGVATFLGQERERRCADASLSSGWDALVAPR